MMPLPDGIHTRKLTVFPAGTEGALTEALALPTKVPLNFTASECVPEKARSVELPMLMPLPAVHDCVPLSKSYCAVPPPPDEVDDDELEDEVDEDDEVEVEVDEDDEDEDDEVEPEPEPPESGSPPAE